MFLVAAPPTRKRLGFRCSFIQPSFIMNSPTDTDDNWITPEIEAIVAQSIRNMDAGLLSEPINEQVDEMLILLKDELDEDWDD